MAGIPSVDTTATPSNAGVENRFALISLTSLFFMWGFITAMNDILIPHLKAVFSLNYTQAMLVQFCFFTAYFLVSIPAGKIVAKWGYSNGLALGLIGACAGCLLFIPSANLEAYWMFLFALFVLAAGITTLQVAANPLVTLLGSPDTSSARLNMTQAFNSLGTTVAPIIGGIVVFGSLGEGSEEAVDVSAVVGPYLVLAALLAGLAIYFKRLQLPMSVVKTEDKQEEVINSDAKDTPSIWQQPHLILGAVGIFVYVGAEVSIGSFLINYFGEDNIASMSESQAAHYVAYYWGGAMIGRFIGAALMKYIAANKILVFNSLGSVLLIATSIFSEGSIAMWSILLVGLCNSIMFPTIFSLAIAKLGPLTSQGSGLLCLAIVGGAIVPLLQGVLADNIGIQLSFFLPLICYLYIGFYGLKGYLPNNSVSQEQSHA